ncbi:hypothetical protein CI610_02063 [invertebrate metagenome]|uniref:Uncharacterized protein n=1 Tax=invertebrate metagenome TaxID=1711999 RepID=A0A2H9T6V6_9ZZZZ
MLKHSLMLDLSVSNSSSFILPSKNDERYPSFMAFSRFLVSFLDRVMDFSV